MIRFENVGVQFDDDAEPVLSAVNLRVDEGELVLVVGATGSGKTTLLRCVNGLVPHFSGGTLSGRVTVDGRDTRTHRPRDLADVVGVVGQDPAAAFVTDTVEEELAYGMESLGVHGDDMRQRVEETLDLLGLADLRQRTLRTLSGGQQQRVAIGGVLTAHPRVLVLDEPTSALDPVAAEEVLAALTRLVHDLGLTVLLAEHRLERVVQYADRVVVVHNGRVSSDLPAAAMATSPVSPPIVDLGRLAGWSPLPLSVRDARRVAGPIRQALAGRTPVRVLSSIQAAGHPASMKSTDKLSVSAQAASHQDANYSKVTQQGPAGRGLGNTSRSLLEARALVVNRGRRPVLRGIDLELGAGEVVALMGRNGSGKSTLLATACGLLPVRGGRVRIGGLDPASLKPRDLLRHVGLVPQDPGLLLYGETVRAECRAADVDMGAAPGTTRALVVHLAPDVQDGTHPRDLSEGQRLALALAIVLAGQPPLVLLDEPTRGLDYGAKTRLVASLRSLAAEGHGVLVATHDVELVAELADRVMVIADGELVTDGPAASVLAGSPAFAPQVAKVMHPQAWLTVADVAAALEAS